MGEEEFINKYILIFMKKVSNLSYGQIVNSRSIRAI